MDSVSVTFALTSQNAFVPGLSISLQATPVFQEGQGKLTQEHSASNYATGHRYASCLTWDYIFIYERGNTSKLEQFNVHIRS